MRTSLTALVILVCFICNAQISPVSNTSVNLISASSIKISNNNYLSLQVNPDKVSGSNWNRFRSSLTVLLHDKDQHVTNRAVVTKGDNLSSSFYYELLKIGSKYWLVYLSPESKNDVGDIVAVEVNPTTLELGRPKIIIPKGSIDLEFKIVGAIYEKIKLILQPSASGTHVGCFIATEKDGFYVAYLDQELNILWQKRETIEKVDKEDIFSILVDDQSNLYLGYKKKYKGFVATLKGSGASTHTQIESGDNNIWDVLLSYNSKTKNIEVAGTYTENSYCRGVYKTSLNSLKIDETSKFPFSEDLIKQLDKEGFASRKGLGAQYRSKLHSLGDGSITITAEMQRVDFDRMANLQTGSVMAFHVGDSGASFAKVPKYSVMNGLPGMHYFAKACGNTLYIFYYDNPENLDRDPKLDAKVLKKDGVLVAAKINVDGTFERKRVNFFGSTETMVSKYLAYECD